MIINRLLLHSALFEMYAKEWWSRSYHFFRRSGRESTTAQSTFMHCFLNLSYMSIKSMGIARRCSVFDHLNPSKWSKSDHRLHQDRLRWSKSYHIFQKAGRKTTTILEKVVEFQPANPTNCLKRVSSGRKPTTSSRKRGRESTTKQG